MSESQQASLAMPFLTLTAHPTIGAVLLDPRPAWVWNHEGNRILWSNAAGVAFFGETSMESLLNRSFGDVHPARRHLARLARNARADTPVLDRLRFFLGETAVTASCLCKRLEVQGEGVLLIMATDQPDAEQSLEARMQELLDLLVADTNMQAAIFDNSGQALAQSGSVDGLVQAPDQLATMIAEADTPLRLAAETVMHNSVESIAALARVGEEDVRHYLAILQDAAEQADHVIDTRALLFAELDEGADVFHTDFGLVEPHQTSDNVTDLSDHLQRNDDVHPFLADRTSGDTFLDDLPNNGSNVTLFKDSASHASTPLKAALSSGASIPKGPSSSNVVALPFGSDKSGIDDADVDWASDDKSIVAADEGSSDDFEFSEDGGPYHFVWESDEVGRISFVSPDLANAVGPDHADLIGQTWPEIANRLDIDQDGVVARAFETRDTWAGLMVMWPVQGRALKIPVELTGLPVFGRYHGFQGFRGFGVCNTKTPQKAPHADQPQSDLPLAPSPYANMAKTQDVSVLPQFDDKSDLMSDDLLLAAQNAVAAAEEMVSGGSGAEYEKASDKLEKDNGVDTVSDEFNDPSIAQDDDKDLAAQQAVEGVDESAEQAVPTVSKDPYDLVSTLLSGSAEGIKEILPSKDENQLPPSAPEPNSESVSDVNSDALSDGERDAFDEIAATLTDGPFEEPESASSDTTDTEPTQKRDDTESSAAREAHQSKLREALKTRSKTDETLRTAATTAFRDILAMDPAFRHMRGHMAELTGDSDDDQEAMDTPLESAAPEDIPVNEVASADATTDNTDLLTVETREEDPHSVEEQINEDDATEEEALNVSTPAVAAAAGVAALASASMWDRTDKTSPLIDLLDKLPTAIIVSAGSKILFASKKALRLLAFETSSDLEAAGGMEGLFTGRPGDWLTKTDGRTTLRGGTGAPVSVLATISSINWDDCPAAMLSFEDAQETAAKTGVSEEDEKIAELEGILDTATDGVVVLDGDASILRMNHSAEALFETDRHVVAGDSFLTLLAEESHKDTLAYLESLKSNGVASVLNDGREIIGRVQSGGLLPLFMTMGRITIPGTNRFCVVLRDIAQWKRAEELLVTEKLGAETANQQKSDMLAKVSHEIRTPLNAIIGFSDVMLEERFGAIGSERYKDYLKDISVSGKHIMNLLNDLLDLSKVEAGKLDMLFEPTQLNRLVSESVGLMQPHANREQIIIRTSLGSNLPDVAGDDRSLRQIILNLLSNALKFTDAGGQVIVSTCIEDNGDVVLRIRDTGIGMNEEDLEVALEPFRQVSTTRSALEGTGLGLPLTKALVEANQSRFSISSEKGHGTLVEVTIPKERVIAKQEADHEL